MLIFFERSGEGWGEMPRTNFVEKTETSTLYPEQFFRKSYVFRNNGTGHVKPATIFMLTNIFTIFIFKTGSLT
jgi:hypothetical protein